MFSILYTKKKTKCLHKHVTFLRANREIELKKKEEKYVCGIFFNLLQIGIHLKTKYKQLTQNLRYRDFYCF